MGALCQSPPHSLKLLTQRPQPLSSSPQKHTSSLHGSLVSLGSALFASPMAALKTHLPFPCPHLTTLLWSHFQLAPIISNSLLCPSKLKYFLRCSKFVHPNKLNHGSGADKDLDVKDYLKTHKHLNLSLRALIALWNPSREDWNCMRPHKFYVSIHGVRNTDISLVKKEKSWVQSLVLPLSYELECHLITTRRESIWFLFSL